MSMVTQLENRAVSFINNGKKLEGRRILAMILAESPVNETAWLSYVNTYDTATDQIRVYEQWLRMAPNSQLAKQGLLRLQALQIANLEQKTVTINRVAMMVIVALMAGLVVATAVYFTYDTISASFETVESELITAELVIGEQESTINTLGTEIVGLVGEKNTLEIEINNLEVEIAGLNEALKVADFDRDSLQGDYENILVQVNSLLADKNNLINDNDQLANQMDNLLHEFATLRTNMHQVEAENLALKLQSNSPPYVYVADRTAYFVFEHHNGLTKWPFSFDAFERVVQNEPQSSQANDLLLFQINNRQQEVVDFRPFVESGLFVQEVATMYSAAPNETEFIRDVWQLVTGLTLTSSNIQGNPQYSLETLFAGSGDCEDLAILFASLILAAPVDWDVELVYMDTYNPDNPQAANHLLVRIKTDYRVFNVDVTKSNMEPYEADQIGGWIYTVN